MSKSTVQCDKCGKVLTINPALMNSDLLLLCDSLSAVNLKLVGQIEDIAKSRDGFEGVSLDYMQGYRDGQESIQKQLLALTEEK